MLAPPQLGIANSSLQNEVKARLLGALQAGEVFGQTRERHIVRISFTQTGDSSIARFVSAADWR
jgi:hypothetical protein